MVKEEQKPIKKSILSFDIGIGKVNLTQRALFAKHLSVMLRSGLTINEALIIIVEFTTGRLKRAARGVLHSVQAGQSLSDSFKRYNKVFGGLFISATEAGEASGTLEENLEEVSKQLEKEKELSSKIKGAMLYPALVLSAAFIMGMGMAFFILPKITPLFASLKVDLPFTTRALIIFSDYVQKSGGKLFLIIISSIIFFAWLIRRKFSKPVTHWLILNFPIVKNISKNANQARFCRTLGMLLKSGLNINEALIVTSNTIGNFYYSRSLIKISKRIEKGSTLSSNLVPYRKLYPLMSINMIRVGEESGRLEETLFYLAEFYEMEVDTATKSLATTIEPLLLMVIGVVVAFLALSIITPIYSITGELRR